MTNPQQPTPSNPNEPENRLGGSSKETPRPIDSDEAWQAEDALRRSEARLRLLVESATEYAIFTMDPQGIIDSWNPGAERIFGWTAEESTGQPSAMIFTLEDRAANAPEKEMETARETGRAADERYHIRKDGSRFYVSGILSPLYHNGQLEGYVKIARDLTERQKAEEALRRAHAELEERVQERTHELQETNADLLAEIAARNVAEVQLRQMASRLAMAEQEERRRLSQILHDDLQQLLYGIQLKLEFIGQGIEPGQQDNLMKHLAEATTWLEDAITITRRLTVDLNPPVRQGESLTVALVWLATQMEEIHGLRVEIEAEHTFSVANEEMRVLLTQVIRELLFNVVKHAGTDQATVALRETEGQLIIEVSDQGRGFEVAAIEADHKEGFGLNSIRERLKFLGGQLEIASRPGEGTRVTVIVPME